jgi:hypothetical protein
MAAIRRQKQSVVNCQKQMNPRLIQNGHPNCGAKNADGHDGRSVTGLLFGQQINPDEKSDKRHEDGSEIPTENNSVADAIFISVFGWSWRCRYTVISGYFSTEGTSSDFANWFSLEVMPAISAMNIDYHLKPKNCGKTELLSNAKKVDAQSTLLDSLNQCQNQSATITKKSNNGAKTHLILLLLIASIGNGGFVQFLVLQLEILSKRGAL